MLKKIIKFLLKVIIFFTGNYSFFKKNNNKKTHDADIFLECFKKNRINFFYYLKKSKSQIRQDMIVLNHLNFKKSGFFVEFGATNGKDLSNTHLLEKSFSWQGILVEPARNWHKDLKKNRSVIIDHHCVYKESGLLIDFNEQKISELSTIANFLNNSSAEQKSKTNKIYKIKTISLTDLMEKYKAPKNIDYLSIDTEGSEYEILKNFDFQKYRFNIITCEHNYGANRKKIFTLLSKNGYKRKFKNLSKFDDWYFKQ